MPLSVDDIKAKFPTKTLPVIIGEPTYENIRLLTEALYGNAASLPAYTGGGKHGHIGLIMPASLYATLSSTAYETPIDPGQFPEDHSSEAERLYNKQQYLGERRVYDNHNNMDNALKSQIIDTIHETYLCEKRNKYTGYLGVSARDLLDHLLARYGQITAADIAACQARMSEPFDATLSIDLFFHKIDDCIQYASDGDVDFTQRQILQIAYHAVSTSGLYTDSCKEWRRKDEKDKTWTNFKTFFAAEYHDLKEQQRVNHTPTNYHGANAVGDISAALDNLALAATSDREIVTQLVAANKQLTQTTEKLSEQLNEANARLISQRSTRETPPSNDRSRRPAGARQRPPFDHDAWLLTLDPMGYCWSHGYKVTPEHSSRTCRGPHEGHKRAATRANPMGGSTKGKPTQN
jgi:hypothetical protein